MKCSVCNMENPAGSRFCRNCGNELKEQKFPKPVANTCVMTKVYAAICGVSLLMAVYSFVALGWKDYDSQPYLEYCDYCDEYHEMGSYVSVSDPFDILSSETGYKFNSYGFYCPYYEYPYYGMGDNPTGEYQEGLIPFQVLFSLMTVVSGGLLYYEWRKSKKR